MTGTQDLAETLPTTYLRNFFAEKEVPDVTFEVKGPSGTNTIPNTVVVEHFRNCPANELAGIERTLRRIDLLNASVNDFLRHLAQALAI